MMSEPGVDVELPSRSDDEVICQSWTPINGYKHTRPFNIREQLRKFQFGQFQSLKYDLFALNNTKTLYQRDVKSHTGCVNAVEFNHDGRFVASGGDDLRVFVWNFNEMQSGLKPRPRGIMKKHHLSNIFTLSFSKDSRRVFSAGNDGSLIVHDIETEKTITHFEGHCFYSISLRGDDDNVVAAGTDYGRIYLFDIRSSPHDPVQTIRENGEIYCVQFNPAEPYYMAACNKSKGLAIFDVRASQDFYKRASPETKKTIYASWDSIGQNLFCIRSGGTPYYLNTNRGVPLVFNDPKYSNKVTIKSCELVHDTYGFTGSDDWNIYCWWIPRDYDDTLEEGKTAITLPQNQKAFTVLKGHRSIVNHVRHSPTEDAIISSGVEKIVKVWSGFDLPDSVRDPPRRERYDSNTMLNSNPDDEEEDPETLRMFDGYLNRNSSDSEDDMDWLSEDVPVMTDSDPSVSDLTRNLHRYGPSEIRAILRQLQRRYGDNDIVIDLTYSEEDEDDDDDDDDDDEVQNNTFQRNSDEYDNNFDFPPMIRIPLDSNSDEPTESSNEPSGSNESNRTSNDEAVDEP